MNKFLKVIVVVILKRKVASLIVFFVFLGLAGLLFNEEDKKRNPALNPRLESELTTTPKRVAVKDSIEPSLPLNTTKPLTEPLSDTSNEDDKIVDWNQLETRGSNSSARFYLSKSSIPFSGEAQETYSNGKLKRRSELSNGQLNGKSSEYYSNGNKSDEYTFVRGKLSGVCTKWSESGSKIEECNYLDGEKSGTTIRWYESGIKSFEGNYLKDVEVGYHTSWADNGNRVEEAQYVDGDLRLKVAFYSNGKRKVESNYRSEKKNGLQTEWHENGARKREANYVEGQIQGLVKKWDEGGKLLEEITYKDGIPDSSQMAEKTPANNSRANPKISARLLELKGQLAEVEIEIKTSTKRYNDALAVINRLTNFKRTPVKQGSAAYYQCLEASKIIGKIEQSVPDVELRKAKLEAMITLLENAPSNDTSEQKLELFKKEYFAALSKSATLFAELFSNAVDYQYYEDSGLASRSFIRDHHQKFCKRWPNRQYLPDGEISVTRNGNVVEMDVPFEYIYRDEKGKMAKGYATDSLIVKWADNAWLITRFRQTVRRTRNDK